MKLLKYCGLVINGIIYLLVVKLRYELRKVILSNPDLSIKLATFPNTVKTFK